MATKAELLAQAKKRKLDVNSSTSKSELESMLRKNVKPRSSSDGQTSGETQGVEEVVVNENRKGEAKNNTTEEGQRDPVENTESIPQNGVTEIETLDVTDNEVAKRADEARTTEEVRFADESNPNQKARNESTEGQEFDQDGNLRTGGKSYGVSADDTRGTVFDEENAGEKPEEEKSEEFTGRVMNDPHNDFSYLNPVAGSDEDQQNNEWSVEDQFKLEESLSDPKNGIQARVTTSAGNYVRIKFFYNNKPLGTFKSRNFKEGDASKFLSRLKEDRGL